MLEMQWGDIAPELRGANYFKTSDLHFGPRYNYAYQFLYVFFGNVTGTVNGQSIQLKSGECCLYGPEHCHEFICEKEEVVVGTVNFSWRLESPERLAMKNSSMKVRTPDLKRLSDPAYRVAGLPKLPFIIEIPDMRRKEFELRLRETGINFRQSDDALNVLKYKSALLDMIYIIISSIRDQTATTEHPALGAMKKFIQKNYASDINRAVVAQYAGISESRLTALMRRDMQCNFTEYLTAIRMDAAIELLLYSRQSIKEIAAQTGFNDYSYFVSAFRKRYDVTPGTVRRTTSLPI